MVTDPTANMGRRLAMAREARGLSTRQVAARLKVSHEYITRLENRVRPVNAVYLMLFSHLYGRSPEWIVWGDDAPPLIVVG